MLRRLVLALLDLVHPTSARTITVGNAPLNVEVFYNRRGDERFVHLVNYAGDKREVGTPQTQNLQPHRDIEISLALDGSARVSEVPADTAIDAEYVDGRLCFRASVAGAHAVYRVET